MRRRLPPSSLPARRFELPDTGEPLAVRVPDERDLNEIERVWGPVRTPETAHWDWRLIAAQSAETFLVLGPASERAAVFSTREPRLIGVEGMQLYRVDFLEVAPELRGQHTWGPVALAVAATRALECGAKGLAIPALVSVAEWYTRAVAAVRVSKYAWKPGPDLVPMKIVGDAFTDLVEAIDGS